MMKRRMLALFLSLVMLTTTIIGFAEPVRLTDSSELVSSMLPTELNEVIDIIEFDDESVVDEPVVDEPVVDEPVIDEPVVDEPVVDEPVVDEPAIDEPVVDEPVVDEPIVDDEPVIDEPIVDEPVVDEPVVDEPVVDEPVIDEPVVDEPVVDEPIVDEPVVDEPVVDTKKQAPNAPALEEERSVDIPVPAADPTVTITAYLEWDDNDNSAGKRPASVNATLYDFYGVAVTSEGNPKVMNEANGWQVSWSDIPEANYAFDYVEVSPVGDAKGYTFKLTGRTAFDWKFVGTYEEVETESVNVSVQWAREIDAANMGDDEIWFELSYQSDGHSGTLYGTLSAANGWSYAFDVPKGADYWIDVLYINPNFSYQVEPRGNDAVLSVRQEYTDLSLKLNWVDGNNSARPSSLLMLLWQGGYPIDTTWVSAYNGWSYTWKNMPLYDSQGRLINYSVTPSTMPMGYYYTYTYDNETGAIVGTFTLCATTSVSVRKIWSGDDNDKDHNRTSFVSVGLYLQDASTGALDLVDTVVLSNDNGWSHLWENLPGFSGASYKVYESAVLGYGAYYYEQQEGCGNWIIENRYTNAKVTVPVTKVWNDEDNQDGKRPATIELTIVGTAVDSDGVPHEIHRETVTLDAEQAENTQTYTFDGLIMYAYGQKVKYTVTERPVDGYTTTVATTADGGVMITNAHIPETTSISVTKVWENEENALVARPESVEVQLLADGELAETVTLSEDNGWAHTWTDLPVYNAGEAITYTVDESVPENYEKSITGTVEEGFVITNTYNGPTDGPSEEPTAEPTVTPTVEPTQDPATPEPVVKVTPVPTEPPVANLLDISGQKIWQDDDDVSGMRPASVTVYLLRDGARIAETTASADSGWSYSFTGMPDIDVRTGKAYTYTISEQMVSGYYGYAAGYNLINVLMPAMLTESNNEQNRTLTVEELVKLIRIYSYEVPLLGELLPTGREIPVYPFVAAALGMIAVIALMHPGRKRRGSR